MANVVADTAPLQYLVLIGEVDLLPRLFGAVAVQDEMLHPRAPDAVRLLGCAATAVADRRSGAD